MRAYPRLFVGLVVSAAVVVTRFYATPAADAVSPPLPSYGSVPTVETVVGGYGPDGVVTIRWGALPETRQVIKVAAPTFMRAHPSLPVLYVTSEVGGGKNLRAVTRAGTVLSAVSSGGGSPVRSDVNRAGDRLAVANYDGSVALFSLSRNGSIARLLDSARTTGSGPDRPRQGSSHPHSVSFGASGTELWVADLGADTVLRFGLGTDRASLVEKERIAMPVGSGPRQVLLSATGLAYVAGELDGHLDVLGIQGADAKLLRRVRVREGAYTAEIALHPSGRWLVALSRGTGECVVFDVLGDDLREAGAVACGDWPRHGAFDRTGTLFFVSSQKGNEVLEFGFDKRAGTLTRQRAVRFAKPAVVVPLPVLK